MSTPTLIHRKTRNRPGRAYRYGEKAVPVQVWIPPRLRERIADDVLGRNTTARDPDAWNISRLIANVMLAYYGMDHTE
ncbi:MAG: hypothetical protein IT199_07840 [Solirubrobacterales bacterium]|nr:hypothetical protein [Solirubrobacterales bacterium]